MTARRGWLRRCVGTALMLATLFVDPVPVLAAEGEASAQLGQRNMRFVILDTLRGLSQDSVYAIVQDAYGFIWIGTEEGLNRYDGYRFLPFRHDPNDPNSLSADNIRALFSDASGVLWIGTDKGGINRYDPATGRFTRFESDPQDFSSLSTNEVRSPIRIVKNDMNATVIGNRSSVSDWLSGARW